MRLLPAGASRRPVSVAQQMQDEVALADKVAFLGAAENHAVERPGRVEAIETHMSWVFLTDRFAYKLKKPVGHPLNDLRSLAARRRNCLAEVRLNRRLAPDVCLGTRPLTLAEGSARLQLGGDGRGGRLAGGDAAAAGDADAGLRAAQRRAGAGGSRPHRPKGSPGSTRGSRLNPSRPPRAAAGVRTRSGFARVLSAGPASDWTPRGSKGSSGALATSCADGRNQRRELETHEMTGAARCERSGPRTGPTSSMAMASASSTM